MELGCQETKNTRPINHPLQHAAADTSTALKWSRRGRKNMGKVPCCSGTVYLLLAYPKEVNNGAGGRKQGFC